MDSIYGAIEMAIMASVDHGRVINVAYFYQLMCTKQNMNLIHRRCHNNHQHEGKHVDPDLIFLA